MVLMLTIELASGWRVSSGELQKYDLWSSMPILSEQFFFDAIGLPGNRGNNFCRFERVDGFRELVGLNHNLIAGRAALNRKGTMDHLGVVFE